MMTLDKMRPGQWAEILDIDSGDANRLMKLSALGLVPGSRIRLQQRSPAFVIWVGETQLSLDGDVAGQIVVELLPNP